MQNKMWQSKRCLLNTLITQESHIYESPTPYRPTHPLKTHQARILQLKRLHVKIHRKDRFQYIILKKWYSQRFAPLLFYKILDLLLICIFTLSNATRSQYISHFWWEETSRCWCAIYNCYNSSYICLMGMDITFQQYTTKNEKSNKNLFVYLASGENILKWLLSYILGDWWKLATFRDYWEDTCWVKVTSLTICILLNNPCVFLESICE